MSDISLRDLSPNTLGELLLELFFDPKLGRGYYENFTPRSNVRVLPEYLNEDGDNVQSYGLFVNLFGLSHHIQMTGVWDCDGSVTFVIKDRNLIVFNNDIKKPYRWNYE